MHWTTISRCPYRRQRQALQMGAPMANCIASEPRNHSMRATTVVTLSCVWFALCAGGAAAQPARLEKIQHVLVIYQENWSFDGLYGKFPGADGLANAGQRIRHGKQACTPFQTAPQP